MNFASVSKFYIYSLWFNTRSALIGTFNQENAFSWNIRELLFEALFCSHFQSTEWLWLGSSCISLVLLHHGFVLYCTAVLYCTVLNCTVLYFTVVVVLAQVIAEKEELPSTRSKSVLTAAVDLADLFIGQIVCSYIRLCLLAVYWLSIAVYLLLSPPPTCVLRCIHSVCVVLSNCHNIALCHFVIILCHCAIILCHFVIILHCVNLIIYNDPSIQIGTNIFFFHSIYFSLSQINNF